MCDLPRFTIMSYNVCGLVNSIRVDELRMFLSTHKPSVIVIQEPQINHLSYTIDKNGKAQTHKPVTLPTFTSYASFYFTHPTKPTGVVFYIHKSCTYKPLQHIPHCTPYRPADTNTIAGFMWVSSPLLPQPVVIGGVYLHQKCKEIDVAALASNIAFASRPLAGSPAMSPHIPVYVLGDLNARHGSWDPSIKDARTLCSKGKWVHKHLIASTAQTLCRTLPPLTLVNNMFTTSRHIPTREETGTVIDIAMTSHPHTIESMHVLSDSGLGSDHWPISITLSNSLSRGRESVPIPQQLDRSPSPVNMEGKYDDIDDGKDLHDNFYPLLVKTSTIPGAGYGLFANQRFKKGERITTYTGEIIDEATKQQRYPRNDGEYVMYVKHNMYIDAVDPEKSSVARYINSSGGGYNNSKISPHYMYNNHNMNIIATRNIAPGEEIFMPYGSSYHMTRAQPPAKTTHIHATLIQPQSHWDTHMRPPPRQTDDGRTRWRINPDVDWKRFEQHIDTPLKKWMHKHKHWMPPTHTQQLAPHPHNHDINGTLHACSFTDGASRGNPGPASCGGVIYLTKHKPDPRQAATNDPIHSFSTYIGDNSTNNEAEYRGLIQALEAALEIGITHLTSYVDSQLVCKQVQGKYEVKHYILAPLHARCMALKHQFQKFTIKHLLRAYNKEADHLCNVALDNMHMRHWKYASDIPDMTDGKEIGLSSEQKQVYEIQQQLTQVRQGNNTTQPHTMTQDEIDVCWKDLHDVIITSAKDCLGTVDVMSQAKSWWATSPEIHALHSTYKRKRRLLRRLKRNTNITPQQLKQVRQSYLDARSAFKSAVIQGKNKDWSEIAGACDSVTEMKRHKAVWNKYKRTKPSTRTPAASYPDAKGNPPRTATEALNNMAAHIANVSSLPHNYVFDMMHESEVKQYLRDNVPDVPHSPLPPSFTFTDVVQTCTSFRLNTALGSDNISPYFLRYGGNTLHHAVYMLFCICSWYGLVPSSFRHAHVMTLYKGEGELTDPDSYRPISITSVIARVYERIHKHELLTAMITAGIPSLDQFGFTRQRSTHDAIYRLLSCIVETFEKGEEEQGKRGKNKHGKYDHNHVPAVFVDISKAYDKVWIEGLLYKLHKELGITGNLYYMIRAMLTSRTVQVVCDGKISTTYELSAGVPQGSILAPLLFLIYIHQLTQTPDNNINVCMSLFADDIAVLPIQPREAGIVALTKVLHHMSEYARKWKITFSSKKTNVVYFKPGHVSKRADKTNQKALRLTNFTIARAKSYTYLGVILDQYLTFIPHVLDVIKRVGVTSHIISRLVRRDHAPSIPVIQTLVKAILVPQMTYGFAFLPPKILKNEPINLQCTGIQQQTTQRNLHSQLKRAMLKPLMRSMGLPYYTHHDSLFVESRLLSIPSLASLASARLAHRWLSNQLDATNDVARLFRTHATCRAHHASHPFTHIAATIASVPAFHIFKSNPHHLLRIEKYKLKQEVWAHQYKQWRSTGTHPLHEHYSQYTIPLQRHLPLYTHIDTPGSASNRARLRLARARLRFDQQRMGFANITSPTCRQCGKHDETVEHVLWWCDNADVKAIRASTYSKLNKLLYQGGGMLSSLANLEPRVSKKGKAHILHKAYDITAKHINKLRDVWDF